MDELKFVDYIKKQIKYGNDVIHGTGDDAAVLKYTRDKYLLFASDMIIEGVHFSRKALPKAIGWKAVAINISDIAAMGGIPKYVVISISIPRNLGQGSVKGILSGIKKACKKFNVSVITTISRDQMTGHKESTSFPPLRA